MLTPWLAVAGTAMSTVAVIAVTSTAPSVRRFIVDKLPPVVDLTIVSAGPRGGRPPDV
ncbi:hypothetical protein GCM10010483_07020 [Actinokineospora diospyrosa]